MYAIYGTGVTGILTYRSKSINQFFGVGLANTTTVGITTSIDSKENIRLNTDVYGYVGLGTTTKVSMRVTGVLANLEIPDDTYYFNNNDKVSIKSLGITQDSSVDEVISEYSFSIKGQGNIAAAKYTVERKILRANVKASLTDYSYIDNYFANVQNTYVKFNQDLLVASSSIPNYHNSPLDFYDRKITLNGEYSGETFEILTVNDHGYYTGDAVYYNPYNIETKDFLGNTTKVVSKFAEMDAGIFF